MSIFVYTVFILSSEMKTILTSWFMAEYLASLLVHLSWTISDSRAWEVAPIKRSARKGWVVPVQHSELHSNLIFNLKELIINERDLEKSQGVPFKLFLMFLHLVTSDRPTPDYITLYVRKCFGGFLAKLANQTWQLGDKIGENCQIWSWTRSVTLLSTDIKHRQTTSSKI